MLIRSLTVGEVSQSDTRVAAYFAYVRRVSAAVTRPDTTAACESPTTQYGPGSIGQRREEPQLGARCLTSKCP